MYRFFLYNSNKRILENTFEAVSFFSVMLHLTLSSPVLAAENSEADLSVSAPSVLLMEASTGTVVYEKTHMKSGIPQVSQKIMTLILIFDAIERGQISRPTR